MMESVAAEAVTLVAVCPETNINSDISTSSIMASVKGMPHITPEMIPNIRISTASPFCIQPHLKMFIGSVGYDPALRGAVYEAVL